MNVSIVSRIFSLFFGNQIDFEIFREKYRQNERSSAMNENKVSRIFPNFLVIKYFEIFREKYRKNVRSSQFCNE